MASRAPNAAISRWDDLSDLPRVSATLGSMRARWARLPISERIRNPGAISHPVKHPARVPLFWVRSDPRFDSQNSSTASIPPAESF